MLCFFGFLHLALCCNNHSVVIHETYFIINSIVRVMSVSSVGWIQRHAIWMRGSSPFWKSHASSRGKTSRHARCVKFYPPPNSCSPKIGKKFLFFWFDTFISILTAIAILWFIVVNLRPRTEWYLRGFHFKIVDPSDKIMSPHKAASTSSRPQDFLYVTSKSL